MKSTLGVHIDGKLALDVTPGGDELKGHWEGDI